MKITTLKGRQIDIAALRQQHGATVAIGNAGVNARGDRLGRGGDVVKSQEDMTKEYYANNPKAASAAPAPVSLKDISDEIVMTPRQAVEKLTQEASKSKRKTRDSED